MKILKWVTMDGRKVKRSFETDHERILFANILYINDYDAYGKISMNRPTKDELEIAKKWAKRNYKVARH